MPCKICRETGHNIKTCRALSAAKSEVISKRHELVIAECKLAEIEKQWALAPVKIYVEKSPDDAKKLQSGSLAFPTSGLIFTESSASSDSEFERISQTDARMGQTERGE